jgi:Fe-Mn family superoxide dismutase
MGTGKLTRRSFVGAIAIAVGGAAVAGTIGHAEEVVAPSETGLSSEGLLVGKPGFQPRTVAPLAKDELPGFLSRAQLAEHHGEYVRATESLKTAEQALAKADRGPAAAGSYAELRRKQVAAANDTLLHELYFRNLAADTVDLPRYLRPHMREHMGSFESWVADFTACALAAKNWAALVYDPYDDRWHNTIMDGDVDGVWIGANPLVVCDLSEHAYGRDYKRREDYVAKFLERIDWNEVAARYKSVDRM